MKKDPKSIELNNKIQNALSLAYQFGQVDGDHHKAWV